MKAALVILVALWIGWHGYPLVFLAAIIAALLWMSVTVNGGTSGAYRTVHGHGATRQIVAAHEAGHAAVVRHIGGSDIHAVARDNGSGWTSFRPPEHMTPAESIAVSLGGALAEGVDISSRQCRGDAALIARDLRRVGLFQKNKVMRQAHQIAATGLRQQRGFATRTARKLERSGRARTW